eukprot:7368689-Pyramimonas_sp.AAC.1
MVMVMMRMRRKQGGGEEREEEEKERSFAEATGCRTTAKQAPPGNRGPTKTTSCSATAEKSQNADNM